MYRRKSLILKIYKKVQRSKDTAFVLADFYTYCTDNDQILRALRKLVADKVLIRIGKGAYAKAKLSKKLYPEFEKTAKAIEEGYYTELNEDISWFCKKFDYRYDEEPWYNSKDAVERAFKFLRSDLHNK